MLQAGVMMQGISVGRPTGSCCSRRCRQAETAQVSLHILCDALPPKAQVSSPVSPAQHTQIDRSEIFGSVCRASQTTEQRAAVAATDAARHAAARYLSFPPTSQMPRPSGASAILYRALLHDGDQQLLRPACLPILQLEAVALQLVVPMTVLACYRRALQSAWVRPSLMAVLQPHEDAWQCQSAVSAQN